MKKIPLGPLPNRPRPGIFIRFALLVGLLFALPHALYTQQVVQALKVPSGKTFTIDGKPDSLWKIMSAFTNPVSQKMNFFDYGKVVLLLADSIKNNPNPQEYYPLPASGSVSLIAAYDLSALYFYFLVKETALFDAKTRCDSTQVWKSAVDIYLDYNPWSTSLYQGYFTTDATGLAFGTSKKTFQLAKTLVPSDTRKFYRDRTKSDKFARMPVPAGLIAEAAKSPSDSMTIGVEMRIPFPAGTNAAFAEGNSIFVSWGYNRYPDTGKADCSDSPILYRWAKHFKSYATASQKPPGWRADDSVHYDAIRSWDGWGQFMLSTQSMAHAYCDDMDVNKWDLNYWQTYCHNNATTPVRAISQASPGGGPVSRGRDFRGRDLRGRQVGDAALQGRGQPLFPEAPWR